MNSILALQKLVRRSFATMPKATQPQAGLSSTKSARVAQASADNSSATSTSAARDATPLTTSRSATATTAAARKATSPPTSQPVTASSVGRAVVQDEHGGSSDTSSANDERPKLQPKHQKDRRRLPAAQYARPDYAAQVTFEKFEDPNDPMPKGYAGTLGNIRYAHSALEDYCPCGTGGGHFLTCGHHIVVANALEPCGTNCKTASREVQPFNCPQCHSIVEDILKNSLTLEEQAKIDFHRTKIDGIAIALAVEYVTKRLSTTQTNIAETVSSIMSPDYGRDCLAVPVEAKKLSNLAEMLQEEYITMEEKRRARLAEENFGPLKTLEKRKNTEEPAETPDSPEAGPSHAGKRVKKQQKQKLVTHHEPVTEQTCGIKCAAHRDEECSDDSAPSAANMSKKPKTKLEAHREPVTEQTRGTKRAADSDGELPDEDTSSGSTSPAANTCKKLKTKLEAHRQPTTIFARGEKRKLFEIETIPKFSRATKRVMTSNRVKFGGVVYFPFPFMRPWSAPILSKTPEETGPLGQLERKRSQDLQNDKGYSSKRQCSLEELPGSGVEVQPVQGERMTMEEWVAVHGDDEL